MSETLPSPSQCSPPCSTPAAPLGTLYILNPDTGLYDPLTVRGPDGARYLEYDGQSETLITTPCGMAQGVVGPQGPTGATGASGAAGANATSLTTASFVMPAYGATVTVTVNTRAWMSPNQVVFVQFAGYMIVATFIGSNQVLLQNPADGVNAYTTNTTPGITIPSNSLVVPGGLQGPSGSLSGAAGGVLKGTYPNPGSSVTTTKGDLWGDSGVGGGTASRFAVGADGTRVIADSTKPLGLDYRKVNLGVPAEITGTLPITNGGTGATTPSQAIQNLGLNQYALFTVTSTTLDVFTSSFTADASASFAHGLNQVPNDVQATIYCVATDMASGYATGQEVNITSLIFNWSNGSYSYGHIPYPITIIRDGTNLTIAINNSDVKTGSTVFQVKLLKADGSAFVFPTSWANFKFKLRALA